MGATDQVLERVSLGQLTALTGLDAQSAELAARHIVSALLGRLRAAAHDPVQAPSLRQALADTVPPGPEPANLERVDPVTGDRLVELALGRDRDAIVVGLAAGIGLPAVVDVIADLLPRLAPVAMGWLAGQTEPVPDTALGRAVDTALGRAPITQKTPSAAAGPDAETSADQDAEQDGPPEDGPRRRTDPLDYDQSEEELPDNEAARTDHDVVGNGRPAPKTEPDPGHPAGGTIRR